MAKYNGTIIGIHDNNRNISISLDTSAKNPPIQVSYKDFGASMVERVNQFDLVEFEAERIGHPFIIRNGVKTSERVKNPRARAFKLLSVSAGSDNLEWDDEPVSGLEFDPTEG